MWMLSNSPAKVLTDAHGQSVIERSGQENGELARAYACSLICSSGVCTGNAPGDSENVYRGMHPIKHSERVFSWYAFILYKLSSQSRRGRRYTVSTQSIFDPLSL